jgi:putative spermidine/putrescine transport system permease protein
MRERRRASRLRHDPVKRAATTDQGRSAGRRRLLGGATGLWLLVVPAVLFLAAFFVMPVLSLLAISLDRAVPGVVTFQGDFVTANFERFFSRPAYYLAALRSISIAAAVTVICLVLGYPLAYLIAKTRNVAANTLLMILVLAAMQLDMVIRLYGMMVLLGDRGLINGALVDAGVIEAPLPLMYNTFGVIVGMVQFTLPFMVLSLIGVIRSIDPSLEEAARSIGANRRQALQRIVLPLSMPGILAGSLIVFALSISSFVVPALMGGWRVTVLPIHIYQQVAEVGNWQLGAALAVVLLALSLGGIVIFQLAARLGSGGRT